MFSLSIAPDIIILSFGGSITSSVLRKMFLHVRNVTDNDGFVIPSLSVEESDLGDWEAAQVSRPQPPPKVSFTSHYSFVYPFTKAK